MPAFFSHYRFGFYSYKDMPGNIIKKSIKKHPNVYILGCQGPDLFFYHLGNYFSDENNYAGRLHEENTGKFLQFLVQRALSSKVAGHYEAYEIQIAYAAGFIAHYCLDCKVHPYVYSMTGTNKDAITTGKHFAFESDIDLQFLKEKEDKKPSDYNAAVIVSLNKKERKAVAMQLSYCVTKALKGVHLSAVKCEAFIKEMELFLELMKDDGGYKGKLGGFVENKLMGYQVGTPLLYNDIYNGNEDACNTKGQLWLHPFTGQLSVKSFYQMFDEAKDMYISIISVFSKVANGNGTMAELTGAIGNYSYKTGLETD